jgi:hypothetical protein
MRRMATVVVALVACVAAAGCATSGVGRGQVEAPGKPEAEGEAVFVWRADADARRGTIEAVLPDGRDFRGTFLQVTSATVAQDIGPGYWSAAGPGYGWGYMAGYDSSTFVRHYSGRVLAQLDGPEGETMRCLFQLARPEDGPASGGMGACELSSGERIEDATLRGEDD